ncbi:EamA family transporter [Rhizobiaceae bacterium BDR2-2]|uniref:EamA family transporter n=1 Tax=Ectorhizobium quercum TaxID=2965071 RepID=A0AAE3N1C9_9HYPH|nr:EamA family transporter [Ectorhizobium quercum]MCX8999198.1 EamA family transporter [Ectorhizobium quercum]
MKFRATLIGFLTILMWAFLATLTAASGNMPPFQLTAVAFALGSVPGLVAMAARPARLKALRQPLRVWLVGIGGLFGYHFLYFTALRNAPAVEATLVNYLWPLLIVVGSALLPGERLGWHHLLGAAIGLGGTVLLVAGGNVAFNPAYMAGYGAALLAAATWASYSLLSRRFGSVPTDAVTGFCFATAILSGVCHLALETTVWPETAFQWSMVVALGLLPLGLAFYTWDYGVKNGDIQVLGAASYTTPILSTLILLAAGYGQPGWRLALACLLVTGGAVLASKDMIFRRRKTVAAA